MPMTCNDPFFSTEVLLGPYGNQKKTASFNNSGQDRVFVLYVRRALVVRGCVMIVASLEG